LLWNFRTHIPDYMASYPRRQLLGIIDKRGWGGGWGVGTAPDLETAYVCLLVTSISD
jgi:hypothetical protein